MKTQYHRSVAIERFAATFATLLFAALLFCSGLPAGAVEPAIVPSQQLYINYEVDATSANALARVELWYGIGTDGPWELYGYDQDKTSPIKFVAPGEGLYRFFVVVVDQHGRRSCDTDTAGLAPVNGLPPNITPHVAAIVDHTPPQLVLILENASAITKSREVSMRWLGFDTNLDARPVSLYYRHADSENWSSIAPPQPNDGRFTWQVPPHVGGRVLLKALLEDRAGNQDTWLSEPITIAPNPPLNPDTAVASALPQLKVGFASHRSDKGMSLTTAAVSLQPNTRQNPLGGEMKNVAQDLFARGALYRKRHEWAQASRAFAQALQYDPGYVDARVNLANTNYTMGNFSDAQKHFEIALLSDPVRTRAIFGLGHTYMQLRNYPKAEQTFMKLVRLSPQDSEAWLAHGDAAAYLGHLTIARTSWQRATQGSLQSVTTEAYKRLANR